MRTKKKTAVGRSGDTATITKEIRKVANRSFCRARRLAKQDTVSTDEALRLAISTWRDANYLSLVANDLLEIAKVQVIYE